MTRPPPARKGDNPFFRFYRYRKVAMPWDDWLRFPRVAGFKNEYWDDHARYTPRPRTVQCTLDLDAWPGPPAPVDEEQDLPAREVAVVRPLAEEDWAALPDAFLSAFAHGPPFSQWPNGGAARRAARAVIAWARLGRDGELVLPACHVALVPRGADGALVLVGGALVTRPAWGRFVGRPHLEWLFVAHWEQRAGLGTLLLQAVVAALRAGGERELTSTCGQESPASLCWHWRSGFRPVPERWRRPYAPRPAAK